VAIVQIKWDWLKWNCRQTRKKDAFLYFPRARNASKVYSDFEAMLIHEFRDIYGAAPLRNRQMEFQKSNHEFQPIT